MTEVEARLKSIYPDWPGFTASQTNSELKGPCPLCGGHDKFWVNLKDQLISCRECQTKGVKWGKVEYILAHPPGVESSSPRSATRIAAERLSNAEAMQKLMGRGITRETIQAKGILPDYELQAWGYPVRDARGRRVGVRWKRYPNRQGSKYWHPKDQGVLLYGLEDIGGETEVWFTPGEPDQWILSQAGAPAFCSTASEGASLPNGAIDELQALGVETIRLYGDLDRQGQEGVVKSAQEFREAGFEVVVHQLPETLGDKGDGLDLFKWHKRDDRAFTEALYNLPEAKVSEVETRPYFDKNRFLAPALGDRLMAERHYANLTNSAKSGRLHTYRDGSFRLEGATLLREQAAAILGDEFTTRRFNEVQAWVEIQSRRDPQEANQHSSLLNVQNGMLNWQTGERLPHSPDYLSTIQFPVSYDPLASCPTIQRFLGEVLPEDCIHPMLELIGYSLIPDTRFEVATMLTGAGANGKSTLMKAWEALLGLQNVSHVPLQALGENRFAAAQLQHKLVNMFPDLDARAIRSSGYFKGLVSGDPIMAERKHQEAFSLIPYARLVFSANRLPRSWDTSEAFFRRWLIIPFPNTFPAEESDTELLSKLTTPQELSGLLNLAVEALRRLMARERFEKPRTAEDALAEYRVASDPILAFLEDRCTAEPEKGKQLVLAGKDALYRAYLNFCESERLGKPDSRRSFNKRLQDLYPAAREWRPKGGQRMWVGAVRLLPEYAEGLPGYTEPLPEMAGGQEAAGDEIPF